MLTTGESVPDGARCALHPEVAAVGLCSRCGNFNCPECTVPHEGMCRACALSTAAPGFHVVPPLRFALMSVLTFGLYHLYWFYKNWVAIKRKEGSDIWPIPRAIFGSLTYFLLIDHLNDRSRAMRVPEPPIGYGMAVGYFGLSAVHRLPDPWGYLALGSFVCLMPAVIAIERLSSQAVVAAGRRLGVRHAVVALVFVPLWLLIVAGLLIGEEGGD